MNKPGISFFHKCRNSGLVLHLVTCISYIITKIASYQMNEIDADTVTKLWRVEKSSRYLITWFNNSVFWISRPKQRRRPLHNRPHAPQSIHCLVFSPSRNRVHLHTILQTTLGTGVFFVRCVLWHQQEEFYFIRALSGSVKQRIYLEWYTVKVQYSGILYNTKFSWALYFRAYLQIAQIREN